MTVSVVEHYRNDSERLMSAVKITFDIVVPFYALLSVINITRSNFVVKYRTYSSLPSIVNILCHSINV